MIGFTHKIFTYLMKRKTTSQNPNQRVELQWVNRLFETQIVLIIEQYILRINLLIDSWH